MSEYGDDAVLEMYKEQQDNQIVDLNKMIIALRTKVSYLEKQLELKEAIPVKKSVLRQILELEAENKKLRDEIAYYKKHVAAQVIINRENRNKPTRQGGVPK